MNHYACNAWPVISIYIIMEKDILKLDLDLKGKNYAINKIINILSYMHDLDFFHVSNIKKVELVYKTRYSARIYLKKPVREVKDVVILQLILGSDYRKEINTLLNYYKLGMKKYPNRLFDYKRYPNGEYKEAEIIVITNKVLNGVLMRDSVNRN